MGVPEGGVEILGPMLEVLGEGEMRPGGSEGVRLRGGQGRVEGSAFFGHVTPTPCEVGDQPVRVEGAPGAG